MTTIPDERLEILPPARPEDAASLAELDRIARLLDSQWRIPGTGIRFGVDAVAGLVPGIGDAAAGLVSAWIIWHASKHGAPAHLLVRMVGNVAVDTVVGSVPIVGSVFDVFYKANKRNMRLLIRHLEKKHGLPPSR
jgi:hypothetical protein